MLVSIALAMSMHLAGTPNTKESAQLRPQLLAQQAVTRKGDDLPEPTFETSAPPLEPRGAPQGENRLPREWRLRVAADAFVERQEVPVPPPDAGARGGGSGGATPRRVGGARAHDLYPEGVVVLASPSQAGEAGGRRRVELQRNTRDAEGNHGERPRWRGR